MITENIFLYTPACQIIEDSLFPLNKYFKIPGKYLFRAGSRRVTTIGDQQTAPNSQVN